MRASDVTLPPLPPMIETAIGPIKIVYVDGFTEADTDGVYGFKDPSTTAGMWLAMEREIRIKRGLNPRFEWFVLWHEFAHAILWEYGVSLTDKAEEHVCDAFAHAKVTAMVRARQDNRPAPAADDLAF